MGIGLDLDQLKVIKNDNKNGNKNENGKIIKKNKEVRMKIIN